MIRLIILGVLLFAAIQFIRRVTDALNIVIEPTSFWIGLMIAVIVAYVFFWLTDWWSAMTRPTRPQAVGLETKYSPKHDAIAASRRLWQMFCVILVVSAALIFYFRLK